MYEGMYVLRACLSQRSDVEMSRSQDVFPISASNSPRGKASEDNLRQVKISLDIQILTSLVLNLLDYFSGTFLGKVYVFNYHDCRPIGN